jgi:hypothetical protein
MKVGDELYIINVTDYIVRKLPVLKTDFVAENIPYIFEVNWRMMWQFASDYGGSREHDIFVNMEKKDLYGYYTYRDLGGYQLRLTAYRTPEEVRDYFKRVKSVYLAQTEKIDQIVDNINW